VPGEREQDAIRALHDTFTLELIGDGAARGGAGAGET
jgi:hypothetical protein